MELPFDGTALVRRVTNEWGEITDDSTEIRTRVVLDGRNLVDIHIDSIGLRYDATMNGVRMARSEKKGVTLNRRNTTMHLSAYIDHSRLLDWWPTHVNNGERTELIVRPHVTIDVPSLDLGALDFTGLGLPQWAQSMRRPPVDVISVETPDYESEFSTSIIDSIRTDESMSVRVFGKKLFEVTDVGARWGRADEHETPIKLRVRIRNPNLFGVSFDDLRYSINMNGVEVGEGYVDDFVLPRRSKTVVTTDAVLRNEKIADWWPLHLRNDERTQTEISVSGTIGVLGYTREVENRSYTDVFETDIFGGGGLPSGSR